MAAFLPWAALLASALTPIATTLISKKESHYVPPTDYAKRYPDKKSGKRKEKHIYHPPKPQKKTDRKFRLKHTNFYRKVQRATYGSKDISF